MRRFKIKKRQPWINNRLINKIKFRDRLLRKYKRVSEAPSGIKNYVKRLKLEIDDTKTRYYRERFRNSNGDLKSSWRVVNELMNGKSGTRSNAGLTHLIHDDVSISDSYEMGNLFNKYFLNIGLDNNEGHLPLSLLPSNKQSFKFSEIGVVDILREVNSMAAKTSKDIFGFSNKFLKIVIIHLAEVLAYLFNQCFYAGIFPSILKESLVLPLHKKGDK